MNKLKYVALILFCLNTVQSEIKVKVNIGLAGQNTHLTTLTEENLTGIGLGEDYDRKLLENVIKQSLIDAHQGHDCYDYRYSKTLPEFLPTELVDDTEIEINWIKEQPYCLIENFYPDLSSAYFPQIRLKVLVDHNLPLDEGKYEGETLQALYDSNFQINYFDHSDESKITHSGSHLLSLFPLRGVLFNQKSINFFDKIRPMFEQNPKFTISSFVFCSLYKAIELAGIPYDDSALSPTSMDEKDKKAMRELTPVIEEYLRSVGLIEAE